MLGSVQEALSDVQEWSGLSPGSLGGPTGCPGVGGGPPECPGVVGRPSRMSGSSRETLPNVQEWWQALPDVREALWMSGSGWESFPDVPEWSGGPS